MWCNRFWSGVLTIGQNCFEFIPYSRACVRARLYTFSHSRNASLISPRAVSLRVFLFVPVNWSLKAEMQYRMFKQTGCTDSLPSALYICAVKFTWAPRCGVVDSVLLRAGEISDSNCFRSLSWLSESSRGQFSESTLVAWSAIVHASWRIVTFKTLFISALCVGSYISVFETDGGCIPRQSQIIGLCNETEFAVPGLETISLY
jgi:hypothetical protein